MRSGRGGLNVGERGRNLSAGEAQLLAFARVAARAPTLLILDEATANVDSVTEQKVQAAIERLLQGRSVLVIHRLSTVRRADKILVMSAGRIVEQGNHDQLIARGGVYAELYRMGFEEPHRRVTARRSAARAEQRPSFQTDGTTTRQSPPRPEAKSNARRGVDIRGPRPCPPVLRCRLQRVQPLRMRGPPWTAPRAPLRGRFAPRRPNYCGAGAASRRRRLTSSSR
jgi:ABC-type multidrug transport system ATPase subunit